MIQTRFSQSAANPIQDVKSKWSRSSFTSCMVQEEKHLLLQGIRRCITSHWITSQRDIIFEFHMQSYKTLFFSHHEVAALLINLLHFHVSINIGCPPFISSNSFTNKVIHNTLRFLFQSRIWSICVGKYRLIVTINTCWSFNWDAHHPQLISETSNVFTALLLSHKFLVK